MHILKNVVVLGATGSIGDSTFKVLKKLGAGYRVIGLSGGAKSKKLVELSTLWRPQHVCVPSAEQAALVASELPGIEVEVGEEGLCAMATLAEADIVINGLVGAVGLKPTLAALAAGKVVAMANKEPLVMAGGLVLEAAKRGGGELLPLDSEPNAIWQCLKGEPREALARVILTASGGPFFGRQRAQMQAISPAEALAHPTWKMGPKITVDSATLMNKGFEVIEAAWLFDIDIDHVDVLVHRQSVVHSLVELVDGSLLAHMGKTDMLLPIQYALTHPQRQTAPLGRLDLAAVGQLSFAEPDGENFPCLELCYEAGRAGGTAPAVLNAANEIAVAAFLQGRIGFLDIGVLNAAMLAAHTVRRVDELATVLEVDAATRQAARAWIEDRA
jgi:1-deoxy-D-xylulose-5-phosphate reductoisomerase